MNLRNNAANVCINQPYFIFGLTNLQIYEMCVFGITSRTRKGCKTMISKKEWGIYNGGKTNERPDQEPEMIISTMFYSVAKNLLI